MNDPSSLKPQHLEDFGELPDPMWLIDADDLMRDRGRIREWTKKIEEAPHANGPPRRRSVP